MILDRSASLILKGLSMNLSSLSASDGSISSAEEIPVNSDIAVNEGVNCNFIALFDSRAEEFDAEDLLWIAAANTEPNRDIKLIGNTLTIDARVKIPGSDGAPARFPNVVTSLPEVIDSVDRRWSE